MKRLLGIIILAALAGTAWGQVVTTGWTRVDSISATLAQNKACTTAAIDVRSLGGFSFQLYDSVKAAETGTVTVKMQGAFSVNRPSKSWKMWTAGGFADSLPASAVSVTAAGHTQIYDNTYKVPRVPYIRYIITNTGDSLWTTLYYLVNEEK